MLRRTLLSLFYTLLPTVVLGICSPAAAQYAIAHRSFGAGTAVGGGYWRMNYQFPGVDSQDPLALLPTLELKMFLRDQLSIDLSVPVGNIAASNAIQDYFFFTAEAFANFHPSAPSPIEVFIAPGFGFTYARWDGEDEQGSELDQSGFAFHIPVRMGVELNSSLRRFSMFIALRPFFAIVHNDETKPGGGAFVEIGVMAYSTRYQANRY